MARRESQKTASRRAAAGVYFAPEARQAYAALAFKASPAVGQDGISRPEMTSYFTSRGTCMGQVPGEVVAAAFGTRWTGPLAAGGSRWARTARNGIDSASE